MSNEKEVARFRVALGLSASQLERVDWPVIPFCAPSQPTETGPYFNWEEQIGEVYQAKTDNIGIWLFWVAYKGKKKLGFINITTPLGKAPKYADEKQCFGSTKLNTITTFGHTPAIRRFSRSISAL